MPSALNVADASAALYSGATLVKGGTLSATTSVTSVKVVGPDGSVRNLGTHPSFEPVYPDTLTLDTGSVSAYSSSPRMIRNFAKWNPAGSGVTLPIFAGFTHLGTELVPDDTQPIYRTTNSFGTVWYLWQPQGWLGRYVLSTSSASSNPWWIGGNSSGLGTGSLYREGVLHAGHWFYNPGPLNPWESAFGNYWNPFTVTGTGSATDWALSLGQGHDVQPGDRLEINSDRYALPADITRPTLGVATISASDAAGHALSTAHALVAGDVVHIRLPVSEPVGLYTVESDTGVARIPWPGLDKAMLSLDIGGVQRRAHLNLSATRQGGGDALWFDYTIASGDADSAGGLHVGEYTANFTRIADAYGNRLWSQAIDVAEIDNTWSVNASGNALGVQPAHVQALVPGNHWPDSTPDSGVQADAITELTFAYMSAWPDYYTGETLPNAETSGATTENTLFVPWTDHMKALLDHVFKALSIYANITFTEVSDPAQAHIAMGSYAMASGIGGYGYYAPDDHTAPLGEAHGDLWINTNANLQGTWIRTAIAHEIGHTLGLKHPGNYNAGGGGTDGPYLDNETDNNRYSVMSYNDVAGLQYPNDYMIYDVAALQYLYGARDCHTEDTAITLTYPAPSFNVASFVYWDYTDVIYDTGGIDTLSVSAATAGVTLNLNQGEFCSIGGTRNFGICFGTVIENAVGTEYDDALIGNNADNTLTGGAGADVFVLGSEFGHDVITDFDPALDRISFARDATVTRANLGIEVVAASGATPGHTRITHGNDSLVLQGVTTGLPDTAFQWVI